MKSKLPFQPFTTLCQTYFHWCDNYSQLVFSFYIYKNFTFCIFLIYFLFSWYVYIQRNFTPHVQMKFNSYVIFIINILMAKNFLCPKLSFSYFAFIWAMCINCKHNKILHNFWHHFSWITYWYSLSTKNEICNIFTILKTIGVLGHENKWNWIARFSSKILSPSSNLILNLWILNKFLKLCCEIMIVLQITSVQFWKSNIVIQSKFT